MTITDLLVRWSVVGTFENKSEIWKLAKTSTLGKKVTKTDKDPLSSADLSFEPNFKTRRQ